MIPVTLWNRTVSTVVRSAAAMETLPVHTATTYTFSPKCHAALTGNGPARTRQDLQSAQLLRHAARDRPQRGIDDRRIHQPGGQRRRTLLPLEDTVDERPHRREHKSLQMPVPVPLPTRDPRVRHLLPCDLQHVVVLVELHTPRRAVQRHLAVDHECWASGVAM